MWIAIAFIAFIAAVSVAGVLADAAKKRASIDLLKAAIERGQTLDPAIIDKLLSDDGPERHDPVAGFRFVGLMCLSTGIGLPILGLFVASFSEKVLPALQGIGALLICISFGWFTAAWFAYRKAERAVALK